MTIRVQWAEAGIQKFQGHDLHDSQMEDALQIFGIQRTQWPVARIILIGDSPDDWVILVNWTDG